MRVLIAACLSLAVGCGKKQLPPPKSDFEAFERKYVGHFAALAEGMRKAGKDVPEDQVPEDYRAVYIGPSGVWVDRKHIATLAEVDAKHAELAAAIDADTKLLPTVGYGGLMVTFDLDAQPARDAIAALRLFAGRDAGFYIRRDDPEVPQRAISSLCSAQITDKPKVDPDKVTMSIFVDKDRTWVGLSRVNEFQEITDQDGKRDLDKIKVTLREHKADALLADRTDVELAASAGTAADIIAIVDNACGAGFPDIALLAPEQLTARPQL